MKFKEMDIWSKILYIAGLLGLVESIVGILYGAYNLIFVSDQTAKSLGSVLIVTWVICLLFFCLEINAAKDNKKILIPLIFSTLNLILTVVSAFEGELNPSKTISATIGLLSCISCVVIFINNKKTSK